MEDGAGQARVFEVSEHQTREIDRTSTIDAHHRQPNSIVLLQTVVLAADLDAGVSGLISERQAERVIRRIKEPVKQRSAPAVVGVVVDEYLPIEHTADGYPVSMDESGSLIAV